jgi:hypothetical protein
VRSACLLSLLLATGCATKADTGDPGDDGIDNGGGIGGAGDGSDGSDGGAEGSDGGSGSDAPVWVSTGPDFAVPCDGRAVAQAQVHVEGQACTVCPAGSDGRAVAYVLNPCPDPVTVTYLPDMLVTSVYVVNETTGEDRGGDGGGGGEYVTETLSPDHYLEEGTSTYRDLSEGVWVFDIGLSADVELEPLAVPFVATD